LLFVHISEYGPNRHEPKLIVVGIQQNGNTRGLSVERGGTLRRAPSTSLVMVLSWTGSLASSARIERHCSVALMMLNGFDDAEWL
jgi:hypothetical protein